MRGIYTSVNDARKMVFAEVARLSYNYKDGDLSEMEHIPYKIVPGEISVHRESVFLERAIVKERMRLAMGLPLRTAAEQAPVSEGALECVKPEKYYQPPLVNIIKFACHKCPDNVVKVTDSCQGCLAHPCKEVCPKGAISFVNGKSVIDQEKCIKCGKCLNACPYGAILRQERPCAKACGMNAIGSDEYGRAEIDYDKCVSCGMCLANCPFGAIADKAQIFQTIQAIRSDVPVYAAIAPAVVGQFGPQLTPDKIRSAFQALGFEDVVEVAIGADLCTIEEAKDFIDEVPDKLPFMATSCCPAWSMMAKKLFPEQADCISMALTPMVLTGRLIKKKHPGCKVAFIGPCAAKKLEAGRRTIRSDVDFVLTFEEVMGMFEAKEVDFEKLEKQDSMHGASGDGRGFAVSGGVANAVIECIKELYPDREVKVESAEGLANCRKKGEDSMQAVYEKLQEKKIWEQTLEKYQWKSENLMEILLDIQKTSRCISDECIKYVAEKLQLDRKFLYSYVRCNDCFSTKKRGKYVIRVCNDTGCHFEKSVEILNGIRSELGLSERKDTTDDGMFTVLESRYCLGACAVGPVIEVNDKIYPSMNVEQAKELVSKLRFG